MTSTGQNRPENVFKEVDSPPVKTWLGCILKKLYVGEGLFRSGPRRKVRSVDKGVVVHDAWRGAALARISSPLATFRHIADATETRENGRLPRTSQRFACPNRLGVNESKKPRVNASRWASLGSRPLQHFLGRMER